MVKIGLHHFASDPSLKQRDGVNLAHSEINRLVTRLSSRIPIDVNFHDFDRLLRDACYARKVLEKIDVILCNVGPHGHYYHALRDKLGLSFRIIRDIKTALWSSYLLQESLCEPLLRDGDTLLATSNYSRALTRHLFPHLARHPIAIFEPVLTELPPTQRPTRPREKKARMTLGHVGRLSEDKNFPQTIELLLKLNREYPGKYELVACGAVHSESCSPERVKQTIFEHTGRDDLFHYLEPVPHSQVVDLIATFDYFLFFSTSTLEVLGRVLIEAMKAGVPILAADHAASSELLPPGATIPVNYRENHLFQGHYDAPMGEIDVEAAAKKIPTLALGDEAGSITVNNPQTFVQSLLNTLPKTDLEEESRLVTESQRDFINQLRCHGIPAFGNKTVALEQIEELRQWFCALNGKASTDFDRRLRELNQRSRFKERTARYIAALPENRGDFTNVGGIDIELCNIAGYFPQFSLLPKAPEKSLPQKVAEEIRA